MNTKEFYIATKTERIKELESEIASTDWLPEIPDEWNARLNAFTYGPGFALNLRFDRNLYTVVDNYFDSIGWRKVSERLDDKATGMTDFWTSKCFVPPGEVYYWNGKFVEVRFNPDMPGSICKRRVIGKKEEQSPVYEFSCEPIP